MTVRRIVSLVVDWLHGCVENPCDALACDAGLQSWPFGIDSFSKRPFAKRSQDQVLCSQATVSHYIISKQTVSLLFVNECEIRPNRGVRSQAVAPANDLRLQAGTTAFDLFFLSDLPAQRFMHSSSFGAGQRNKTMYA